MLLINEEIKNSRIKLVGDYTGEMSITEALQLAYDTELDLVEMQTNEDISICKIMNYSKYLYELKKSKKSQKKAIMKDIKLGCNIADHDLYISHKKCKSILDEGNKVRVLVVFKGRQIVFASKIGDEILTKYLSLFEEGTIQIINKPKLEGNNYSVIIEKKNK